MTSEGVNSILRAPILPVSGALNSSKKAICDKILEHSNNINNPNLKTKEYYANVPLGEHFSIKEKVQFKRFYKGLTFGYTHFKEKTFSNEKMSKWERSGFAVLAIGSFLLSLSNVVFGIPGLLSAAIYCGLTKIDDESLKKQDSKDQAKKSIQELNDVLEPMHGENLLSPYKQLNNTGYNHNTDKFIKPRIVDEKFSKAELVEIKTNLTEFVEKIKASHPELAKTRSIQQIEEHVGILSEAIKQAHLKEAKVAYQILASEIIGKFYPRTESMSKLEDSENIQEWFVLISNNDKLTKGQLLSVNASLNMFINDNKDLEDTPFINQIKAQNEMIKAAADLKPTVNKPNL